MKSSESRWLQKMAAFLLAVIVMIPSAAAFAAEAGKTVRVGWVEYPRMAEVHDGKYSGYNYDYLMEIAKYTGWEYEFVSGDVQTCSKMLAEGEIDLLGLLLYTPERTEFFDYAMMENGRNYSLLFTTLSSSVQPHDFDAFNGMKVGVLSGGDHELFQEYENDNGFSCDIVDFAGVNELTVALFSGEIDAAVTEGFVNDSRIRVIAEIAAEPYYFATTKGNKEILVGLNRALSSISIDRPYIERELYDKYFGIEFNPELNDAELALVEASKKEPVTLGVIPSSAPACFWDDEKGELAGIFMDILKALSEKTGLRFEYVALDPEKGSPVAQLKRGSPELVAGVLKTQSFAEDSELVLSDKLTDDSLVFVGRRGDDFTQDPEEKIIAVCQGFQVGLEYAAERFPQQNVVECQNVKDGLELVKSGKADAALYMQTSVSYYMQDPHYESLEIIAAFTRNMNTCVVGLAEDDQLLMSVINKGLAMLSDNERSSILMDYTIMNSYHMNLGTCCINIGCRFALYRCWC